MAHQASAHAPHPEGFCPCPHYTLGDTCGLWSSGWPCLLRKGTWRLSHTLPPSFCQQDRGGVGVATWGTGRDMEPFTARDKVLPDLSPNSSHPSWSPGVSASPKSQPHQAPGPSGVPVPPPSHHPTAMHGAWVLLLLGLRLQLSLGVIPGNRDLPAGTHTLGATPRLT